MAKSKNASQHNQTRKAHRNGIHRPHKHRYAGMTGVDPKFRRNARYAAQGTQKALLAKRKAEQADKSA